MFIKKLSLFLLMLLTMTMLTTPRAGANAIQSPLFTYQGYVTNSSNTPLPGDTADYTFSVYDPSATCLLYQETQLAITTDSSAMISARVGSDPGSPKRNVGFDPGLNMSAVFANSGTVGTSANCPSGYTPTPGDARLLRVVVTHGGVPTTLVPDAVISSVPTAMVAESIQGIPLSGLIQNSGTVTPANMGLLTSGAASDASALHNHDIHDDARYARLGAADSFTGNLATSALVGVGTVAPGADIDIEKSSPALRIGGTAGAGNTTRLDFFGSGSQQASIQSQDNLNILKFYTGATLAMSIDNNQVTHFGSAILTGTENLGKYTNAQEISAPFVAALTPAAEGMIWENSNLHQLRYWDGSSVQSIASTANSVSSVTAGTGITIGGTPTAPTLSVNYGTAAGTAIQGNASFGGDATGTYSALSVMGIQGRSIAATLPTNGQALVWNNGATQWQPTTVVSSPGGGNTQIQFNSAGALAGNSDFVWDNTNHGLIVDSTSPPVGNAFTISQNPKVSATNSLIQLGASNIAAGSGQGTFIGANPAAGFTGDFIRLQVGSVTKYSVESSGTPVAATDLANKAYVDTQSAAGGGNFLKKDGSVNLTSDWAASVSNLFKITGLKDPTLAQDAATKNYVDTQTNNANYLPKAGGTMTGTITGRASTLGAGTAPVKLPTGVLMTAPEAGAIEYDGTNLYYTDGTNARKTLGVAGVGITSLNGESAVVQSFANAASGTAPNFTHAAGVHTLNIPLASTASVSSGEISNADYTTFSGKVDGKANLTTVGSVPFVSASGVLNQDNAKMFYDSTNHRLGIGTATPTASLDVTGAVKINDGTQGTGKILTSDASGNATWQSNGRTWARSFTLVTLPSTALTCASAITVLSATLVKSSPGPLMVSANVPVNVATANSSARLCIYIDNVDTAYWNDSFFPNTSDYRNLAGLWFVPAASAGSHTVDIRMVTDSTGGASVSLGTRDRVVLVWE